MNLFLFMNVVILSLYIIRSVCRYTIIGLIIDYFGLDIPSTSSIEPEAETRRLTQERRETRTREKEKEV